MATERRAPEDLQEAVAATLRRLRGEIGQPGQIPAARQEPVLGPTLTGPGAPFVATPPAAASPPAQPDLLSRAEAEHEIPPNPSLRLAELRETLAKPDATDRQRPRLLPYMLSILALAVFAGIGWWAYRSISGTSMTSEVPVVAASQVPEKVPPTADQAAAGTSTTSGDKTVYNEVAPGSAPEPKTEVLLPPPEAPQLPPTMDSTTSGSTTAPATSTPSATSADTGSTGGSGALAPTGATTSSSTSTDQAAGSTGATTANGTSTPATSPSSSTTEPAATAPATSSTATQAPATSTAATAPASGMTETLIPSGSTSSATASSAEPASAGTATAPASTSLPTGTTGQGTAAPASDVAALPAAPLTVENTPSATTSTDSANSSTASTAAAAPTSATATTTTAAPASATPASPTTTQTASLGNYRIQLASLKSEAAAEKTWKRLSSKYKDVLASLTVHIQKVALASGTFYRLQAGPFEDRTAAADACAKLKAHGQQCLVKP